MTDDQTPGIFEDPWKPLGLGFLMLSAFVVGLLAGLVIWG